MNVRAQAETKVIATPRRSSSASTTSGFLQRRCACGGAAGVTGECEACKKKRLGLQTKLTVNEPGDIYEQEADRVADLVTAGPAASTRNAAPLRIQRFSGHANGQVDVAPASVDRALASPGKQLDSALMLDMAQRFGHDFSRVRVHTGASAEQSVRDVNAKAYTIGHDMVFGAGLFAPGTIEGRRLIAHELTHVVQQSSDANRPGQMNVRALQRKPDESALAKAADPIDEEKFPDYAWHRVMQISSHGSPTGDVIRVILEENTAIGRDVLKETTRKSTYRNYLKGGTKRPSYFSFVHPTRGVVARAFAALAGFHPEKKPVAKVLLEEAHAYEIYVFSPHSVNDPPHYAYPVPLSSAPPLTDVRAEAPKAAEQAVPVTPSATPLPEYMTCTRPADCVIAQLKLEPNLVHFMNYDRFIDRRIIEITNSLAPLAMGELLTTLEEVRSRGWLFYLVTLASLYPLDLRDRERAAIYTVYWNTPSKVVSVEIALALAATIPQAERQVLLDYDFMKAKEKRIAPLLAALDISRPKSQAELNQEAVILAQKQWRRVKFLNSVKIPDHLITALAPYAEFRNKLEELDIYWDSAEQSFKRKPFVSALETQVDNNSEAHAIYRRTYADLEYNEPVEKSTFKKVMDVICENTSPCKENIEGVRAMKASGMSDADAEAIGLLYIFTAFIPSEGPQGPIEGPIVRGPGPPVGPGFELPEFKLPTLEPALATPKLRTAVPEPSPTMKPIPIPEPTPTVKPTVKPDVKPTAKLTPDPIVDPVQMPKQTPKVTPGAQTDVLPITPTRIAPDTQQQRRRRCPYPTGRTPFDAIPIRWLKPRDDSFYPETIELNGGVLERDDPETKFPDGVRVGVQERFWPRLGKVMRLVPSVRSGAEGDFAATLALWGYQSTDTLQIDHVQDLQWCGADTVFGGNFWPLESSTNMSAGGTQNNLQRVTFCPSEDSIPAVNWTLAQLKEEGYYGRYFTIQEVAFVLPPGALGLTVRPYAPDARVTCDE